MEAYGVTHYARQGLQHYTFNFKEEPTKVIKDQLYHIQNVK